MSNARLVEWQQNLIRRLERDLGRELVPADMPCIAWNQTAHTLTVEQKPLRAELQSRSLISNVYRSMNLKMSRPRTN